MMKGETRRSLNCTDRRLHSCSASRMLPQSTAANRPPKVNQLSCQQMNSVRLRAHLKTHSTGLNKINKKQMSWSRMTSWASRSWYRSDWKQENSNFHCQRSEMIKQRNLKLSLKRLGPNLKINWQPTGTRLKTRWRGSWLKRPRPRCRRH